MKSTLTSALTAVVLVLCSAGTGIAHQKDRLEINGAATNTASSGKIRAASRFLSSACQEAAATSSPEAAGRNRRRSALGAEIARAEGE